MSSKMKIDVKIPIEDIEKILCKECNRKLEQLQIKLAGEKIAAQIIQKKH